MTASELYKAGQLEEAITAQLAVVKANPADQGKRFFLFELLLFLGDLDRAQKQIEAITFGDERDATVIVYKRWLDSERLRRACFTTGGEPKLLAPPSEHVRLRLEALRQWRANNQESFGQLVHQANALMPPLKGELDGKAFSELRDCDDLLAGVMEVWVNGLYYWIPFENIASLNVMPPEYPRDLYALTAQLEVLNGDTGEVWLPVLYPNTHTASDPQFKLGRGNDWQTLPGDVVMGVGLKCILVEEDAIPLPEWRELTIHHPEPESTGEGEAASSESTNPESTT